MTLHLCAIPAADLVQCAWCGILCPRTDHGAHMCVKCSVYDSLQAEPVFEEDEVTTHVNNDDYGDSAYDLPYVDARYYDEEEQSCGNDFAEDGTGGTSESLAEPTCRSPCSMFLKLKAILALERQPIPVAQFTASKGN